MIEKLLILVMCHMIGDYVLQTDFLAKTKGENWYHLIVHSVLYSVPFFIVFGNVEVTIFIIISHIIIDAVKARFKAINYVTDQILHYIIALLYLI